MSPDEFRNLRKEVDKLRKDVTVLLANQRILIDLLSEPRPPVPDAVGMRHKA